MCPQTDPPTVPGEDVNESDVRNLAATQIAEALGDEWTVGRDYGTGLGTQIDHPAGLALRITVTRKTHDAYLTVRAVMPDGTASFEPSPISARADRGGEIANDICRKIIPEYTAALDSAWQHLLGATWGEAR